jgi:hypothetical protein
MRRAFGVAWVVLAASLAGAFARVDDPPAKDGEAVLTDINGTEHKLSGVRFTSGTRHLSWLADPNGSTPGEKLGPVAIELREPNSTTFAKGIITLVPAASVESAKYDYEKQIVSLTVKGLKEPLTGTLEYKGINALGLSGTADGKTASFTAGALGKSAVKSIAFGGAVPVPAVPKAVAEKGWSVKTIQSGKKAASTAPETPAMVVRNLKALYQFSGVEQLIDGIPVRKGTPVPFDANLKRFEMLANDENTGIAAAEIEVGAGPEKIVAIPLTMEQDKRTGTLVGFLGEVDAGYKLFPLHTVKAIAPWAKIRD